MKETEKKLIVNLFKKIKDISLQTPNKDSEAEKLINYLIKNQNDSVYYMIQTLLVQDILIKELNDKVKNLQNQINQNTIQNTSFLSDHLKRNILDLPTHDNKFNNSNSYTKKVESNVVESQYSNNKNNVSTNSQRGGISNFLSTAIQTAVGVAGGMVAGNMLTNFLHNHDKENHILDHDNHDHVTSSDNHIDSPVNNFFQIDPEDEISSNEHGNTDDLDDDVNDFDEDF